MATKDQKPKKRNSYILTVSADIGKSYAETRTLMNDLKTKYDLKYSDIAKNKLLNYEGAELEAKVDAILLNKNKRYNYAINRIMESTGWTKEYTIAETDRIKEKFKISAREYWIRELYAKTDEEIAQFKEKSKAERNAKIEKIAEITGWSVDKVKEHMAYCNTHFGVHNIEYYSNFKCWELTDEQLAKFAIDEDSRNLSKLHNKKAMVLNNKLLFNETFSSYLGRKYWINRDSSFEEFKTFAEGLDKVFCKPLNLSMGVGTKVIRTDVSEEELKNLYDALMKDNELLAEEFIVQHHKMNEVYSGCVNTVRFTMLRDGDECHNLWSFARFGSNGIVDNFHGGGMAAAVDVKTGILISDAMNSEGRFFKTHPVSGVQFKGFQIPHWDKVLETTEAAMRSQDFVNYVGWDVAICEDKVVIVEGNATPQVGVYQSILAPTKEGQKPIYERFLSPKDEKEKSIPEAKKESISETKEETEVKSSGLKSFYKKLMSIIKK